MDIMQGCSSLSNNCVLKEKMLAIDKKNVDVKIELNI